MPAPAACMSLPLSVLTCYHPPRVHLPPRLLQLASPEYPALYYQVAAATARTGCGDLVGARYLSFRWAGPLPRWLRWLSVFGVGRDARHLLHKRDGVDAALAYDDSGTRLVVALLVVVAVDDPWAVVLGSGDWEWGWGVAGW